MDRVKLNERLEMQIIDDLAAIAFGLEGNYVVAGAIGVKRLLEGTARYYRGRYGLNHWRTAVMRALAEHDDFCNGGFRIVFPLN